MIEALTKAKLKQYGFDNQSIQRLTTWKDYECMLQNDRGCFFASNKENKIYSGTGALRKHYFKNSNQIAFPFWDLNLISEYYRLKQDAYIKEQKKLAGISFIEQTAKERFKQIEIELTNNTIKGLKAKPQQMKTVAESIDKYTIYLDWLNAGKGTFLIDDKADLQFSLLDLFPGPIEQTTNFKSFKRQIENHGFMVFKTENGPVNVYRPELAVIFNSKELKVTEMFKSKEIVINGLDYVKTFTEAYREGESYFDIEFGISTDTLYGQNAEAYIKGIHENYIHIKQPDINDGWQWAKRTYPLTLSHKEIRKFGYYSGIVSKVGAMVKKHPKLFATYDKCDHEPQEQIETKPTITAYAIMHVYLALYLGQAVTPQNKNVLAKKYGYNSGNQLRNNFTFYQNEDKLLDLNTTNRRSANTHLKRFKDILPLLEKENKAAYEKAKNDLEILEKIYTKHY